MGPYIILPFLRVPQIGGLSSYECSTQIFAFSVENSPNLTFSYSKIFIRVCHLISTLSFFPYYQFVGISDWPVNRYLKDWKQIDRFYQICIWSIYSEAPRSVLSKMLIEYYLIRSEYFCWNLCERSLSQRGPLSFFFEPKHYLPSMINHSFRSNFSFTCPFLEMLECLQKYKSIYSHDCQPK